MASRPRTPPTRGATPTEDGQASPIAGRFVKPLIARQRISQTLDPFGAAGHAHAEALLPFRALAVQRVFVGLQEVVQNLGIIQGILQKPTVPTPLVGVLHQPDGTNAAFVQLQFTPSDLGGKGAAITVITAADGGFKLPVTAGLLMPDAGVPLVIHGANGNAQVVIAPAQIAGNGLVGAVVLPQPLSPLPVSILASLKGLVPTPGPDAPPPTPINPAQLPVVTLGEDAGCQLTFGANNTVDKYPYGVFFRLVEPRLSIVQEVRRFFGLDGNLEENFLPLTVYATQADKAGLPFGEKTSFADRVPVEQPLSVDGFRDQIMGLGPNGVFTADETVPMAATLGLGYVLWMSQQWTFQGVGLGDLVYSLPLAPGEQQQIAVFERVDTSAVFESESFTEAQAQQSSATADTSTAATFASAFEEAASGGSAFHTDSSTSSWGASILIASGGGGNSSSSGGSSSWLQGQRDSTQQAAQTTHSAASNQASARRSASRTGMRMATASEQESVTTKTIANHNHAHALTMQYWEVQRVYNVTTAIDGLTLTCLVPMQIVRFIPPNQTFQLNPGTITTPAEVLARYGTIVKHIDVLAVALPRSYRHGLELLQQFASDPTATVESSGGLAEDVIDFSIMGGFLPCEDVRINVVTRRGTRVGPVKLTNTSDSVTLAPDLYASRDDLIAALAAQRRGGFTFCQGRLALPTTMSRSDVVGFEISRTFHPVDYTLISQEAVSLIAEEKALGGDKTLFGSLIAGSAQTEISKTRHSIHISPAELETALGGPEVGFFSAFVQEISGTVTPPGPTGPSFPGFGGESYASDPLFGVILSQQPLPVPALRLAPLLRFGDILEIEKMAQHVARNTTRYSKAVWTSLTSEERAILLDQYTIGVPPGGISDESQMVPLLNCVQNKLLGFFGNSMIMPFIIPQSVAESMNINPAELQEALLAFQKGSFTPPQSTIALPTRGVLGEAVLGHCPSAEKIDLTRFWNWADSPGDSAPAISPVTLPTGTPSLTSGLTAPNSLTTLPSIINNVATAPTPDLSLLQALGTNAANQKDFSTDLTGASQLAGLITNAQNVSNAARADALKTTKDLQSQAMATVGNIVGGIYGGNPNAGSNAAAALNGGAQTPAKDAPDPKANASKAGAAGSAAGDAGAGGAAGAAGDAGGAAGAAGLLGDAAGAVLI